MLEAKRPAVVMFSRSASSSATLRRSSGARVYALPRTRVRIPERHVGRAVAQAGSPSARGPPPTRFTTLFCNYHHKVDFTSSKSPRKGMLHFAHTPLHRRAPNRRLSTTPGLQHHLRKTTLAASRFFRPSNLPATSLFSSSMYLPTTPRTLKPAEGCLLLSVWQFRWCKDREPRARWILLRNEWKKSAT